MSEEKIIRLTADINRFAFQKGWLSLERNESVADRWRVLRFSQSHGQPIASPSSQDHDALQVWENCATILGGILQQRHAYVFSRPVDPIRDGVPNYFDVVQQPMDLGTVKQKLALNARRRHEPVTSAMYKRPEEFKADVDLVWKNCFLYNPPGYEVHDLGTALKAEFERRWKSMRIEEKLEKIRKKTPPSDDKHYAHSQSRRPGAVKSDKWPQTRKPRLHESTADGSAIKNKRRECRLEERRSLNSSNHAKKQIEKQLRDGGGLSSKHNTKETPEFSRSNKPAATEGNSRAESKKKIGDVNHRQRKQPSVKRLDKTSQEKKVRQLLGGGRKRTAIKPEPGEAVFPRQPQSNWKPPISRGEEEIGSPPDSVEKPLPSKWPEPIQPIDTRPPAIPKEPIPRKCGRLYEHIKKSMEKTKRKLEEQMSDYEVRRLLSILLEEMSPKVLHHSLSDVIAQDPCFKHSTTANIDQLEIRTVRRVTRAALNAARKKRAKSPKVIAETVAASAKRSSVTQSISPASIPPPAKRKRAEDDGSRLLATKTPVVSPPSPPWHRRLTHKREVWDKAVGLYGVTPRQEGFDLGLTPKQESNGSSWEEAVPDDVEDGEILD